jgi:aldose 1-epimerase
VLGYDSLEQYFDNESHFGAIVGRYANRIAKGEFELDGKIFTLPQNEGSNCLHSGPQNFSTVVWDAATLHGESEMGIELRHKSKHGHNGFPGTVRTIVRYFLNDRNELIIEYEATTDKTTVINLTNHSYFNLSGNHKKDVLRHRLKLAANRFTPVSANLIPVSDIYEVKDTVMDFREFREIGERIDEPDKQLEIAGGYDHNYILDHKSGQLGIAAIVQEPESGRSMEVRTTLPGVQFYTANHFDGSIVGKSGIRYQKHTGFCLETQHFPDSPNRPDFPSTVLRPGQTYRHTTVFRFFHQDD